MNYKVCLALFNKFCWPLPLTQLTPASNTVNEEDKGDMEVIEEMPNRNEAPRRPSPATSCCSNLIRHCLPHRFDLAFLDPKHSC